MKRTGVETTDELLLERPTVLRSNIIILWLYRYVLTQRNTFLQQSILKKYVTDNFYLHQWLFYQCTKIKHIWLIQVRYFFYTRTQYWRVKSEKKNMTKKYYTAQRLQREWPFFASLSSVHLHWYRWSVEMRFLRRWCAQMIRWYTSSSFKCLLPTRSLTRIRCECAYVYNIHLSTRKSRRQFHNGNYQASLVQCKRNLCYAIHRLTPGPVLYIDNVVIVETHTTYVQ